MLQRISTGICLAVLGSAFVWAQNSTLTITAGRTDARDGRQMYTSYCASCHGMDGRGRGTMAPRLKTAPTDLTMLSRNNGGTYPALHVKSILQFASPDHPSSSMPAWGSVLGEMDRRVTTDMESLRIRNLVEYIETLQAN